METTNIVTGFIPTREDFRWKFAMGVIAFICSLLLLTKYQAPTKVAELIEGFGFFVLFSQAMFWLGKKVVRFTLALLSLVAIGMLIALSLGNTPVIAQ